MTAEHRIKRDIDRLHGICEFALSDGCIEPDEAKWIFEWLTAHAEILDTWPANILYDRLTAMLADGVLDQDEQRDLLDIVMQIARPTQEDGTRAASTLPLNAPPPPIEFSGRSFCFTGVFDFGSRAQCQAAVERLGGIVADGITKKLHYLVIGNVGSEMWRHSTFGSKIAKAVEYRDAGISLQIISETHWVASIASR